MGDEPQSPARYGGEAKLPVLLSVAFRQRMGSRMFVNSASAFGALFNSANVAAHRRERCASHRRRKLDCRRSIMSIFRRCKSSEVNENAIQEVIS
jgi:hypothetical protein